MAITQTARLERETEETRAQLEHTLEELRARMSPGQLLDQATGYLRNSSGRAFLGNLRDEVVHNPAPVALIGAGIAWLAISSAIGRRTNGNGYSRMARDWGETAATAHDLAHGDRRSNGPPRARQATEGWVDDARDAVADVGETVREGVDDIRDRAGTMFDETIGRARHATEGWVDDVRSAAAEAGETLRERGADMYSQTVGRARRAAGKAAEYGRAARHAVEPNGALMNFCREQPMLVAGLGVAFGAALAAMIPASRTETRIMGEASRTVRDRVTEAAAETLRSASESGRETEPDSAADVERGVREGSERPIVDSQPESAVPYAEAAEAGATAASEKFGGGDAQPRG